MASGTNAHAEGQATYATAQNAHSEGRSSTASTQNAHAEGYGTIASHQVAEHAEGKYNVSNADTISSIGVGTGASSRTNAFEVLTGGTVYMKGVGTYNGTNPVSGTNDVATVMSGKANITGAQNIVVLSQSDYDSTTKAANTVYIII